MLTGPVFTPDKYSIKRITPRSLRRRIDYYLSVAGLKRPRLSAHSLRSTSATLLMENGGSLLEIQQHLGHKSPETTIKYIARLDQVANKVADKIPIKVN